MFAVFKNLGWFFSRERKRYLIGVILLIIAGVLELAPPKLLGSAIDEISGGTITVSSLVYYISVTLAILVVIYGITYVWMHSLFGGSKNVYYVLDLWLICYG